MPHRLRSIAVTVVEPAPGRFRWRLLEARPDESWHRIAQAPGPVDRYAQAMADGLLALQTLVDDLDQGPRTDEVDGAAPHADEGDADTRDTTSPSSPKRGAFFGFGGI